MAFLSGSKDGQENSLALLWTNGFLCRLLSKHTHDGFLTESHVFSTMCPLGSDSSPRFPEVCKCACLHSSPPARGLSSARGCFGFGALITLSLSLFSLAFVCLSSRGCLRKLLSPSTDGALVLGRKGLFPLTYGCLSISPSVFLSINSSNNRSSFYFCLATVPGVRPSKMAKQWEVIVLLILLYSTKSEWETGKSLSLNSTAQHSWPKSSRSETVRVSEDTHHSFHLWIRRLFPGSEEVKCAG